MALQLTDLKVGRCSSSFLIYLPFFQPGLGAKRRPRNSPEELDRNYVVCRSSQGEGVGWGGVGWGWVGTCLPPHIIICRQSLKKYLTLAVLWSPKSAAKCRGSGETRRSGRQAAATERSCKHLRLQQILQLHQRTRGLLRPLFNRYKSKRIS